MVGEFTEQLLTQKLGNGELVLTDEVVAGLEKQAQALLEEKLRQKSQLLDTKELSKEVGHTHGEKANDEVTKHGWLGWCFS